MNSPDTNAHVRGESPFVDDLPEPVGLFHAQVFGSPSPHGRILGLDVSAAAAAPGVVAVLTAADIPGENQLGTIMADEPLLARSKVHYMGQPVALVVARTREAAQAALPRIVFGVEEIPPVLDPRQAAARGDLIAPARTLSRGEVDGEWDRCATVVQGRVDSGGQEHLYLETQATLAIPEARGRLRLFSSTQSPSMVQRFVARILALQMHDIEVEVQRLGGAFGGKEDQATPWAAMAALAAHRLERPVKLVLGRNADMRMTGKRHPYTSDYRLGLDGAGKFLAFQVTYFQNSGALADLSPAILERTLFHATGSYYVPNVRITGMCCRTNLPPFTAFRGFGAPQAMFVMEAAICAAAEKLQVPAWQLQQANLLGDGDEIPCGMQIGGSTAHRSFNDAIRRFALEKRQAEIEQKNASSPLVKHGLAVMPICFGISFTNIMLNQAGALVHIYTDGSVSVSTGAVEMGQGVATKLRRIVAQGLGIGEKRVRLESTSTARVANMSPTAASTGADLNGAAALQACRLLGERLKVVGATFLGVSPEEIAIRDERVWRAGAVCSLGWDELVQTAYCQRIDLSAHAYFATPGLHYDRQAEHGHPFAYHVWGTALVEARLDVLRGTAAIVSVQVVHDAGRSLDPLVDLGQAEGGIVQGIGWLTCEELVYDEKGRLLTDSLSTYKVPDFHFSPPAIEVVFLEDITDPSAVMQSKGIGEPPFMYGIGAFFAIRAALRSVRDLPAAFIQAPLTNERILHQLLGLDSGSGAGEGG